MSREGSAALSASAPLRIRAGANLREHWAVRAKRTKQERAVGYLLIVGIGKRAKSLPCPVPLRLVRIIGKRGRAMDSDNLPNAFKAIRDGIATALGVDDGDRTAVEWSYAEERGKDWGVRVEIRSATPHKLSCASRGQDCICGANLSPEKGK